MIFPVQIKNFSYGYSSVTPYGRATFPYKGRHRTRKPNSPITPFFIPKEKDTQTRGSGISLLQIFSKMGHSPRSWARFSSDLSRTVQTNLGAV